MRRDEEYMCVRMTVMDVPGRRMKGRQKRMWMYSIKYDLTEKGLSGEEAQDLAAWRE